MAGAPAGDLVARDRSGVLWLYLGKGDGTFAPRTRISDGWGPYRIIAPGDVDGDGRNDLVTIPDSDSTNTYMRFYYGTGQWRTPFPSTEPPGAYLTGLDPLL
ncbi:FG-GAP repeat domain-containing protein [Streptomyces sp. NPDC093089]|uniref:FG-GAP repeat domain-containing protein n=1 Tax=Streptomyces sp. NPDC093089 TaxID=3366024 RepID=UPI0037F73DA3